MTDESGPRPGQYHIRTLLVVVTLAAIASAVMAGILRAGADPGRDPRVILYVVLALAAPTLVLLAAQLFGRRTKRQPWLEPEPRKLDDRRR